MRRPILGILGWVAATAPVAEGEVEIAVAGVKGELSAIVPLKRLLDVEEHDLAVAVGDRYVCLVGL